MEKNSSLTCSLLLALLTLMTGAAIAQPKFNSQFGLTFQSLSDDMQKIKATSEVVEADFSADIVSGLCAAGELLLCLPRLANAD